MEKVEILAPAGNLTCLQAAISAGADAVYFGVENFNMRAKAGNFSTRQLKSVVEMAHDAGVKAYLTLNAMIHENELAQIEHLMEGAARSGIDAVIGWDFAVLTAAKRFGVSVVVSTQMSVSNTSAIRFLHEEFGANRFVLARECSFDHIRRMRRELVRLGLIDEIELEAFVHGAMCVAQSGRCFLSYHESGKSANRGECQQLCRREYEVTEKRGDAHFRVGPDYILSAKDMCTMPFIEKLIENGIKSFKIEGRNRSPEYVHTVTSAYRRAVDYYFDNNGKRGWRQGFDQVKQEETERLRSVYNRGFSNGFYFGKPSNEWAQSGGNQATHRKVHLGRVLNYYKKAGVAHIRIENRGVDLGDELLILGDSTGVVKLKCDRMVEDEQALQHVDPGHEVTIPVCERVRKNDKVYVLTIAETANGGVIRSA